VIIADLRSSPLEDDPLTENGLPLASFYPNIGSMQTLSLAPIVVTPENCQVYCLKRGRRRAKDSFHGIDPSMRFLAVG
jgi:hypothetical protein